ncbi:30S ribosomal protein S3 [Candidatus Woesearchaeota archaeon]|nr:30S ribosomal protein S3 [Candidatus Woesearchaeota archaeon]
MIEREFVEQKMKEFHIQEFISSNLSRVGYSHCKLQRTPLGEKIVIYASRPGLIVGRGGANINRLTKTLKKKFNLENPQIEINEVENVNLDPDIIAERIANSLERYGTTRFKGVGHKTMADVMRAGALGVEILISGKIPSTRAKNWRFYMGYLKKCGDIAQSGVLVSQKFALLKSGIVGIKVSIMPPDIELTDKIQLVSERKETVEETDESAMPEAAPETKPKRKEDSTAAGAEAPAETKDDEKQGPARDE